MVDDVKSFYLHLWCALIFLRWAMSSKLQQKAKIAFRDKTSGIRNALAVALTTLSSMICVATQWGWRCVCRRDVTVLSACKSGTHALQRQVYAAHLLCRPIFCWSASRISFTLDQKKARRITKMHYARRVRRKAPLSLSRRRRYIYIIYLLAVCVCLIPESHTCVPISRCLRS